MAKCNNCGTSLSCGCHVRVALDKQQCCTSCVSAYNQKLTQPKVQPKPVQLPKNNQSLSQL